MAITAVGTPVYTKGGIGPVSLSGIIPADLQAGDYVVIVAHIRNSNAAAVPEILGSTGGQSWIQETVIRTSGVGSSRLIHCRYSGTGDLSAVQVGDNGESTIVHHLVVMYRRGCAVTGVNHADSALDSDDGGGGQTASTSHVRTPEETFTDGCDNLIVGVAGAAGGWSTAASGWNEIGDADYTNGQSVSAAVFEQFDAFAAHANITISSAVSRAVSFHVLALRPDDAIGAHPTVAGESAGAAGDASSHTVPLTGLGTIAAGDKLLVFVAFNGNITLDVPTGWTSTRTNNGSAITTYALRKTADGGETSIALANLSAPSDLSWRAFRLTGANGIPLVSAVPATSSSPNASKVTHLQSADALSIVAIATDNRSNTIGPAGYPSGYTGGDYGASTGSAGNGTMLGAARKEIIAGTDPLAALTGLSEEHVAWHVSYIYEAPSNNRSGTGTIAQASSASSTGARQAAGTGTIAQAIILAGTAAKGGSSSPAVISSSAAAAATGAEGGIRTAAIGQAIAMPAAGSAQRAGTGTVAIGASLSATGAALGGAEGAGSIDQLVATIATGRKATAAPALLLELVTGISSSGFEGGIRLPVIGQATTTAATGSKSVSGAAGLSVASAASGAFSSARSGIAALPVGSTMAALALEYADGTGTIATITATTATGKRVLRFAMMKLLEAVAKVLEPPPSLGPYGSHLTISGVTVDLAGEPFTYKPGTLYVWIEDDQQTPASPELMRQDFRVRAVYVGAALDEEPKQRKRRDVSIALDTKRSEYLDNVRASQVADEWEFATASVDWDWTRTFEGRAFAVEINGYRHIA